MTLIEQEQNLHQVKSQVAEMLLMHAGNGINGNNRLAQREIASKLETGWATVHLALKSLLNDGAIRIERNRIIVNKELLQKTAGVA